MAILIRSYLPSDERSIQDITYMTGYQGEDLGTTGLFDDPRLWFLIFIYYYTKFEPQHVFIAHETDRQEVIGYICGSPDSARQKKNFAWAMTPRIALRTFFWTSWKHPQAFATLLRMARVGEQIAAETPFGQIEAEFPAHLHINVLPGCQRLGVGSRLLRHFESHLESLGVRGVHLQTTSYNTKAIPFYENSGYRLVHALKLRHHPLRDGIINLTYAKKLHDPNTR